MVKFLCLSSSQEWIGRRSGGGGFEQSRGQGQRQTRFNAI